MKRVNIALTESQHTKAKILALLQGETLNDYLAKAVAQRLKEDDSVLKKVKEATKG